MMIAVGCPSVRTDLEQKIERSVYHDLETLDPADPKIQENASE